jgi:hypothetical protein
MVRTPVSVYLQGPFTTIGILIYSPFGGGAIIRPHFCPERAIIVAEPSVRR